VINEQQPARVPVETASSWLRIARALLVGFALGLVVHVMVSMLLVQLGAQGNEAREPRSAVQCRKQSPSRQQPASIKPSASVTPS
jgi:hypothetical protein